MTRKLLVALPDYPTPAFLKLLGKLALIAPKRDWSITMLGHRADDHNQLIHYPKDVALMEFEVARQGREARLNYLRRGALAFGQQLLRLDGEYDLAFSPCANWLMIDDWTLSTPLVALISDFSFEALPGDSFFRTFFWETTWRIGERAQRALFADDFASQYAQREYGFPSDRVRVLWRPTAKSLFDALDEAAS